MGTHPASPDDPVDPVDPVDEPELVLAPPVGLPPTVPPEVAPAAAVVRRPLPPMLVP